jgi:hypothetical protein
MGRRIWDVDVAGSNPVTPTNYLLWGTSYGDRERTGLNRGLFWEHRAGGVESLCPTIVLGKVRGNSYIMQGLPTTVCGSPS